MTTLLLNIISLFTFIGMTLVIISIAIVLSLLLTVVTNKRKRTKRNNNKCINDYIHKRRF